MTSQRKRDLQTMNNFSDLTRKPDDKLFFRSSDAHDVRLGSIVSHDSKDYDSAQIVLLGSQTIESGNADSIREEFYKLTNFGITRKIIDLGNVTSGENFTSVVEKVLEDKKRLIVFGEENFSYSSGAAIANAFGKDRWLGININSHLDTFSENPGENNQTFRRLMEDEVLLPRYFYEIGFQPYFCTPAYFKYLQNQNVKLISLEQMRSRETPDLELRELVRQEFINHSRSMDVFFNFSMNAVRASDAPGVSASSPFGLRAGEFLTLVLFAAKLMNTKMIQFTDFRQNLDHENRTAKLIAIGLHRFCSSLPKGT